MYFLFPSYEGTVYMYVQVPVPYPIALENCHRLCVPYHTGMYRMYVVHRGAGTVTVSKEKCFLTMVPFSVVRSSRWYSRQPPSHHCFLKNFIQHLRRIVKWLLLQRAPLRPWWELSDVEYDPEEIPRRLLVVPRRQNKICQIWMTMMRRMRRLPSVKVPQRFPSS